MKNDYFKIFRHERIKYKDSKRNKSIGIPLLNAGKKPIKRIYEYPKDKNNEDETKEKKLFYKEKKTLD